MWLVLIVGAVSLRLAQPAFFHDNLKKLASSSALWVWGIYLLLGCLRGFTFTPATVLIAFGILFLDPIPLFVLTMLGTLVSSAAIYYSSSLFEFYEQLQKNNKKQIDALQSRMTEFELPIIIGWSFCPVLPTDVVCCVSGIMKLNLSKLLLGVLIGEGICSAIYIFCGIQILQFLGFAT